ncbi:uncharacterized protein LOC112651318 isoform X2 [Canis lupus dingo]|uniref:uncharacterized protein LOC112651318 isoform X2 n=1 Tax=Canis lupus dingo TaxID=286419 RepID=UPI0020C4B395|nr:uncharacterized protein LOC112651318 isoform X2 [Canis lupus dingo]
MASTNPIPSPGESRASGVAEKVGSSSLWVPAPALPLLLLLLLPPPLLSPGSFLHRLPAWRNFHQGTRHYRSKTEKLKTCEGAFDLYFILDTPKLRVSFITYSTEGHTLMKLTSDKNKIRDGLAELQNVVPTGATHMQEGFIKVNERSKRQTLEVNKAVRMKSTVYFVAYKDYKKEELRNIVQTPSQVYKAERFQSLNRMLNSLVGNSCTKVTSEMTYFVCLKGLLLHLKSLGMGLGMTCYSCRPREGSLSPASHVPLNVAFSKDYSVRYRIPSSYQSRKDEILCRYKLKDNSVYEKKPYRISQNNIFCPRHEFQKDGEVLQSDYSLDNGKTYEGNLKITAIFCVSAQDDPLQNVDNQPETTVLTVVTAEITVTTAETPPTTMDPLTTTQSTTEPVTTMRTTSVVKQESTANTDILPHHLGPTGIRPKTTPKAIVTTVPMVVTEERTLDNSVVYALVILTLGVIVLVLCCFYCCLRPRKELPAVQIIQRDSNMCTHTCTRLTLPSCRFQENNMRRIEGKLDTLCDFVQCYNQMPLLWYQPRSKVCTEACSHGSTGASSRDCSPSGQLSTTPALCPKPPQQRPCRAEDRQEVEGGLRHWRTREGHPASEGRALSHLPKVTVPRPPLEGGSTPGPAWGALTASRTPSGPCRPAPESAQGSLGQGQRRLFAKAEHSLSGHDRGGGDRRAAAAPRAA